MMKLKFRSSTDFYAGLLFVCTGLLFAWASTRYQFGTSAQMGPGYFPAVLGYCLAAIGLFILVRSFTKLSDVDSVETLQLRPIVLVLGSVVLFGATLNQLGLVISSFVMLMLSALATYEFHWKYALLTAITLTGACYLIFIVGLNLPIPVWPGV